MELHVQFSGERRTYLPEQSKPSENDRYSRWLRTLGPVLFFATFTACLLEDTEKTLNPAFGKYFLKMGCSPSKGNNFGTLGPLRKGRMLPPPPQESPREDINRCSFPGSTDWDTKERKAIGQSQNPQKEVHFTTEKRTVPDLTPEAVNMDILKSKGLENSTLTQKKEKEGEKPGGTDKKLGKKAKKNTRSAKTLKKKEKHIDKLHLEPKVDFPEPLVNAHQAAYAFLNPSINKYDTLVELLEQATQTQVLVQPMVTFMALRYEEIIQGLEEMADEGENVFKEYGEHLAWPSQMKNLSSCSALKSGPANGDPPPDLLQQLLQYTTQRMRNVSHSVSGLGDAALEEAVEYFASVSELLEEKLKVKRAVETRLMQLLCRIEMASLRKPGPEDSALFSEDSGIGGESESLAGSDKQHRPESCGSTGTNRTMSASPIRYNSFNMRRRTTRQSQISPSVSLTSLNSLGSACTILANDQRDSLLGSVSWGEDDDDEADEEMKGKQMFRSRSISVDSDHPRRMPPKRIENPQNMEMTLKMKNAISGRIQFAKSKVGDSPKTNRRQWSDEKKQTPKRPQTAKAVVKKTTVTRERRSQSAESLRSKGEDRTLLELERTQKDLNQKLQKMWKNKTVDYAKTAPAKPNQRTPVIGSPKLTRKNTSLEKNVHSTGSKEGPVKRGNKRQEVMHHIEEDKPIHTTSTNDSVKPTPPPTPPSSPRPSSSLSRGRKSVKKLIDTFTQGIEEREGPRVLGPLRGVRKCGVPVIPGLGNVEAVLSSGITSCRPESEVEKTDFLDLDSLPPPPMEVLMDNSFECARSLSTGIANDATKVNKSPLPKRAMVSQRLKASVQPVTVLPSKGGLLQAPKMNSSAKADSQETPAPSKVSQPDPPEKSNSLYQQATRIINVRHSHAEKPASCVASDPPISQDKSVDVEHNSNATVPGPNATVFAVPPSSVRSQPPASPPVSKTRMLPSTPTTPSLLHRRLPSPSNLRRQPRPPSSSSSSTNSTPPSSVVQRRLPSPPVAKPNMLNSNSVSYPFKAPSPPASPKLQRWSRENSREDLNSPRKMNNARSVFCPASSSLFEAPPCPKPPEAWTSTRVSVLSRMWGGPGYTPRSFIRRTQSDRRPSLNLPPRSQGVSFAETCGSEPMICSHGLDDEPAGEEDLWGNQSEVRAPPRSASHPDLCIIGQSLHTD